jgi:hypothetical protein
MTENARALIKSQNLLAIVETTKFEHEHPQPHFINPCCFGEDFADWLRQRALSLQDSGFTFSTVIQEDYGWGFWSYQSGDSFWIAVSYIGEGSQDGSIQWAISLNYDPRFNLLKRLFHTPNRRTLATLRNHILAAMASEAAIVISQHYERV